MKEGEKSVENWTKIARGGTVVHYAYKRSAVYAAIISAAKLLKEEDDH